MLPPSWRTALSVGVAGVLAVADPCAFESAYFVRTEGEKTLYYSTLDQLRSCLADTTVPHSYAWWTLHDLFYGVSETYSFTDIVVDSASSVQSNACGFDVHPVNVDLQSFLQSQIREYKEVLGGLSPEEKAAYLSGQRSAYDFHMDITRVFNQLGDAHTIYASPYDMFRWYLPVAFDSKIEDGQQKVTLRYQDNDDLVRLSTLYREVFGVPVLDKDRHNEVVVMIDGYPILDWMMMQVEGDWAFYYQDPRARLNSLVFSKDVMSFNIRLFPVPETNGITLTFADGTDIFVKYLVQGTDAEKEEDSFRSTDGINQRINSNSLFEAYMEYLDGSTGSLADRDYFDVSVKAALRQAQDDKLSIFSKSKAPAPEPVTPLFPQIDDENVKKSLGRFRPSLAQTLRDDVRMFSARELPDEDFLTEEWIELSSMSYTFAEDAVIVRIPSFVPKARTEDDEEFMYFPEFLEVYMAAQNRGVTRILLDLVGNGGGYVKSSYALQWFFIPSEDVCSSLSKRMTENWRLWIQSFGTGLDRLLNDLEFDAQLSSKEFLESQFDELERLTRFMYGGMGLDPEFLEPVQLGEAVLAIRTKRFEILAIEDAKDRRVAYVDYLRSKEYLPAESYMESIITPEGGGWFPFSPFEQVIPNSGGKNWEPPLKQYLDLTTKQWGRISQYSRKAEFAFCPTTTAHMDETYGSTYSRDYWTEVAFMSDGSCGSACSMFTQNVQLSGYATGFTYGALADKPLDVSSFAGGNVLRFDGWTANINVAAHLGVIATAGKSTWAKLQPEELLNVPIALPSPAIASFNWNMMFASQLGDDALPRQFYRIPGQAHLPIWVHSADRQVVYREIIVEAENWNVIRENPQFPEAGVCPSWEPAAPEEIDEEAPSDENMVNDEDESVSDDPCAFATGYGFESSDGTDIYYSSMGDLKQCLDATEIPEIYAWWTLRNLFYGVAETYSFTDIVVDTQASKEHNDCGFKLHDVNVDIETFLKTKLNEYKELFDSMPLMDLIDFQLNAKRKAWEFHAELAALFNQLNDAHTLYVTPFDMFRWFLPFGLDSSMREGEQVVTLRYKDSQQLGVLAQIYENVFESPPFPSDDVNGEVVTQINGLPPLEWLLKQVNGEWAGQVQDPRGRLNSFVFGSDIISFPAVLFPTPAVDTVTIELESGVSATVDYVVQVRTRPNQPTMRNLENLNAFTNFNPRFKAFMDYEMDEFEEQHNPMVVAALQQFVPADVQEEIVIFNEQQAVAKEVRDQQQVASLGVMARKEKKFVKKYDFEVESGLRHEEKRDAEASLLVSVGEAKKPALEITRIEGLSLKDLSEETLRRLEEGSLDFESSAIQFYSVGSLIFGIKGDVLIVIVESFVPDPINDEDDIFIYYPEFYEIFKFAKSVGVTRILLDMSENGGGYVLSSYALQWFFVPPEEICPRLAKRMTHNWNLWISSFASGFEALLDELEVTVELSDPSFLRKQFSQLKRFVIFMADGMDAREFLGSSNLLETLDRFDQAQAAILSVQDPKERRLSFVAFLRSKPFLPEGPYRDWISPEDGWFPFDTEEYTVPGSQGEPFDPPLRQYLDQHAEIWGREGIYSTQGEFSFCWSGLETMEALFPDYERDYWTQVAFVTEGTCGSACSMFTTSLQLSGRAAAFTYGGLADTPMDVSSFCGGNVEDYDDWWKVVTIAAKLGNIATAGMSKWIRNQDLMEEFVKVPVAFPTRASSRFNWNMLFAPQMGVDAMPRQFYIIPAHKHLNLWAHEPAGRELVYDAIIAETDWPELILNPQFQDDGFCPAQKEMRLALGLQA